MSEALKGLCVDVETEVGRINAANEESLTKGKEAS